MAIGAVLGGIAGLAGTLAQNAANRDALNYQYANLAFQKQQAREQNRLAQAARTDAYGNEMRYDRYLNKWITDLTPTQEAIIRAGEREQRLNLTEDAKRNRDVRRRKEVRSKQAESDYTDALAEYRYGGPASEKAIRALIGRQMRIANARGVGQDKRNKIGEALRKDRGELLPNILRLADDTTSKVNASVPLQSRQAALQEFISRSNKHNTDSTNKLNTFANIANGVDQVGITPSNVPATLAGTQSEAFRGIADAIQRASANVGNAYQTLSGAAGQAPDFSGLANALAKIKFDTASPSTLTAPVVTPQILTASPQYTLADDPLYIKNRVLGNDASGLKFRGNPHF